ncbi:sigma-70 family RNA polymerase sigma factor [Saccharothrix australiensis]|uniref:RNA polymerase sigma factor (Sigma-70 family) n=1 Tax=Saccharothrix australiensis TaxID=2072 RepID=A0A495W435_9PSEU|nr:sigma-70 family RNA polymerase sigma factor [Saccharothrix australiensis]RKT55423.1 RNA polymerase sigma factor (sigma-70 family) [Saccharothrix australiensis]
MIGQPDEHEVERWLTADPAALRHDLDRALRPEVGPHPSPPPSDVELVEAVRGGAVQAYGRLYERHVRAARNLARSLVRSEAEADDLVSEAFAKVLGTLRSGGGPESAFRPYLLTALRHAAYDRARRDRRLRLADDVAAVPEVERTTSVPFQDPALAMLERSLASRAFASLPERWQAVLWHTEIEGQSPAEVAPRLGLTTNGVSALAHRAREGLRKAYLQAHLARSPSGRCRATVAKLGAWTRRGLARRETTQVEAHLDRCDDCRALADELADVNGTLRAFVAPLVLGPGAAGYLAATAGPAKAGVAAATGAGAAAHSATSTAQWLGAAASATAVVLATTLGVGPGPEPVRPPAAAPTPASPHPTTGPGAATTTAPAASTAATPGAAASTTATAPTGTSGTTDAPGAPGAPGASERQPPGTSAAPPSAAEPLAPVVPAGFALPTGGPPTEFPVTLRNTGSGGAPAPTLVLALPDGVRVVGPGGNLVAGPLVRFDGAADRRVGCPAGQGSVTCAADQGLAAGASVTFVFRLLAGPKAVGGTISGTVTAGALPATRITVPVTITPKK